MSRHHPNVLQRFWDRRMQNVALYSRLTASRRNSSLVASEAVVLPQDIQLQCLDANSLLLLHDRFNFRPGSAAGDTVSLLGSSLDLEWEHEYGNNARAQNDCSWLMMQDDSSGESRSEDNISMNELPGTRNMAYVNRECDTNEENRIELQVKRNQTTKMKSNANTWSHISTPESLEWDVHEDDQKFKSEEDLLDQETIDLLQEIERLKNRALDETGDHQWTDEIEQES